MATFPNRTKSRAGRSGFRCAAAPCNVARPPAAGSFFQKQRGRAAAAAQRLCGRFRPKYADLARRGTPRQFGTLRPARYVVSRPTRKNTIFASRAAPQYFSRRAAEKPQAKARRFRLSGLLSGLSNGKRSSSPGRPPVSPLPFRQTQFKRGPRAKKTRSRNFIQKFPAFPYSAAGGKLMVTTRGEVERSSSLPS